MPELPEVQTTVNGINKYASGRKIVAVWSDYRSDFYVGKNNIKDPHYFKAFERRVKDSTIVKAERRAKHILIHLSNQETVLVHMKMTGHFLYGNFDYKRSQKKWQPPTGYWNKSWPQSKEQAIKENPFSDPFNDFIHLVFVLDNEKQLAFSDMRKFASISVMKAAEARALIENMYGPEPLDPQTSPEIFIASLQKKPNMNIKTALLDQSLIAGFGNIYSDETLWAASVHPESKVGAIPTKVFMQIYHEGKKVLQKALRHGGDSMGDYRTIEGKSGDFQNLHNVYKQEGKVCSKCGSVIEKKLINQRVGRFCPHHQKRY